MSENTESPVALSPFNKECARLLNDSQSRGRHSLMSAFDHLSRGWAIAQADPTMAMFRGITAEEEAATAIFYALKERGYDNADKLNPWDHTQKSALVPFIIVVGDFMQASLGRLGMQLHLHIREEEGRRLLMIRVPMVVNGKEVGAYPIPPLNLAIKVGAREKPPSYSAQLKAYLQTQGAKEIITHARELANLRNRILYAGPIGFARVEKLDPNFLRLRKIRVMALLCAFLLIEPHKELQPFVQDCLNAFADAAQGVVRPSS